MIIYFEYTDMHIWIILHVQIPVCDRNMHTHCLDILNWI